MFFDFQPVFRGLSKGKRHKHLPWNFSSVRRPSRAGHARYQPRPVQRLQVCQGLSVSSKQVPVSIPVSLFVCSGSELRPTFLLADFFGSFETPVSAAGHPQVTFVGEEYVHERQPFSAAFFSRLPSTFSCLLDQTELTEWSVAPRHRTQ